MLIDAQTALRIDPARMYLVGFSGTAHYALAVAPDLDGHVAAVVAVGGAMPPSSDQFLAAAAMEKQELSIRALLEAGVHFGHQTRRWNPKMRPYIFTERNGIHIVDLRQTLEQIETEAPIVSEPVKVVDFEGGFRVHRTLVCLGDKDRLVQAQKGTSEKDALIAMTGQVRGIPVVAAAFEFRFMGGSMASVNLVPGTLISQSCTRNLIGELSARDMRSANIW